MIEKLEPIKCFNCSDTPQAKMQHHNYHNDCINKINELVDAVNDITDWIKRTDETIVKYGIKPIENTIISKMENVDPYAEQRKWIGKLCRCWDSDINDDLWGILQDIKDNKTEKYYLYGIGYEHCEPVKLDDDIIYKGE